MTAPPQKLAVAISSQEIMPVHTFIFLRIATMLNWTFELVCPPQRSCRRAFGIETSAQDYFTKQIKLMDGLQKKHFRAKKNYIDKMEISLNCGSTVFIIWLTTQTTWSLDAVVSTCCQHRKISMPVITYAQCSCMFSCVIIKQQSLCTSFYSTHIHWQSSLVLHKGHLLMKTGTCELL